MVPGDKKAVCCSGLSTQLRGEKKAGYLSMQYSQHRWWWLIRGCLHDDSLGFVDHLGSSE